MANQKPLTLRRQKSAVIQRRNLSMQEGSLQAQVWIDTGVFHLEQEFSYFVPEHLVALIKVGSVVRVPFKNEFKTGVVASLTALNKTNLLSVDQVFISEGITAKHIGFAQAFAARYATSLPQVLQSMLYGVNLKGIDKGAVPEVLHQREGGPKRQFLEVERRADLKQEIKRIISKHKSGSLLILFPSINSLQQLLDSERRLERGIVEFGSHLPLAKRKDALGEIINGSNLIVAGVRGALFAPIKDLTHILIVEEFSNLYFEQHRPYWNVRDVALLRSESEDCDLTLIGSSCSLEIWRLIEKGWVQHSKVKTESSFNRSRVATLPRTYHSTIRMGLEIGPVLVCVAGKDYAAGFVCFQCRNRARCTCGGYLFFTEKNQTACSVCNFKSADWKCVECDCPRSLVYSSGAKKIVEELGKAFPNERIILNTAEKPIDSSIEGRCIVVSTYGIEPEVKNGYGAIVLLDGEFLIARRFIRAEEETFNFWRRSLSFISSKGAVYLSLFESHPVVQSLIVGRIAIFMNAALRDREQVRIPPNNRVVKVLGEPRDISGLRSKLNSQFGDQVEIYTSQSGRELTIKVEYESAGELLIGLKALQKLRSAGSKQLFELRVDPFQF